MRRLKCWLGFHESVMDDHGGWRMRLWADVQSECIHCGKRREWHCHDDTHWEERHDERIGERFGWFA